MKTAAEAQLGLDEAVKGQGRPKLYREDPAGPREGGRSTSGAQKITLTSTCVCAALKTAKMKIKFFAARWQHSAAGLIF
jgi:hypothetical protein